MESKNELEAALERALNRVWQAQGREGTFADFRRSRESMSEEDKIRERVEIENRKEGNLNAIDGYNCKKCLNRGDIWYAWHDGTHWREGMRKCSCLKARASIQRLERSGLKDSLKKFSEFVPTEEWQKNMLNVAQAYAQADLSDGTSLFIGGAVGCGKTHICSAVCRELLYKGHEVIYMPWANEMRRLKGIANTDAISGELATYSHAEILYIDDLFKPAGESSEPTPADIRMAYEIINHRYINKLPIIVSSEKHMHEVLEYDEATISRLYERAKGYTVNIARQPGRNYRMKGADAIV